MLLAAVFPTARADSTAAANPYALRGVWLSGSAASMQSVMQSGSAASIELNVALGRKHLFTARQIITRASLPPKDADNPAEGSYELALLYGRRAWVTEASWVSFAAGLAQVKTMTRGPFERAWDVVYTIPSLFGPDVELRERHVKYQARHSATIGIPLAVQFVFQPLPVIGVGINVSGNLNLHRSFVNTGIEFTLGWVK